MFRALRMMLSLQPIVYGCVYSWHTMLIKELRKKNKKDFILQAFST